MAAGKIFTFNGVVESVKINLISAAVFLPHHIIIELPKGRLKVSGILNGTPFSLALLYRKELGRYFPISSALRKTANVSPGDSVNITFRIIQTEKVELALPLETVLTEEDKTRKIWKKFSITLQRIVGDYIDSVKRIDMRIRKTIEMIQRSRHNDLQNQPVRKKKNT
jgi:hypothetical protein